MQVNANSTAGALLSTDASPAQQPGGSLLPLIRDLAGGGILKRVGEVQVGEYVGTGAALDVALDFDPIFVYVSNLTDSDVFGYAFNTANNGTKSIKVVGAAGPATVAAQGILFAAAGLKKFSLGTDAGLNETGKTFQFIAIGA